MTHFKKSRQQGGEGRSRLAVPEEREEYQFGTGKLKGSRSMTKHPKRRKKGQRGGETASVSGSKEWLRFASAPEPGSAMEKVTKEDGTRVRTFPYQYRFVRPLVPGEFGQYQVVSEERMRECTHVLVMRLDPESVARTRIPILADQARMFEAFGVLDRDELTAGQGPFSLPAETQRLTIAAASNGVSAAFLDYPQLERDKGVLETRAKSIADLRVQLWHDIANDLALYVRLFLPAYIYGYRLGQVILQEAHSKAREVLLRRLCALDAPEAQQMVERILQDRMREMQVHSIFELLIDENSNGEQAARSTPGSNGDGIAAERFSSGVLTVARILPAAEQALSETNSKKVPVAIVDTSNRPDIDLGALATVIHTEESVTLFSWDMATSADDLLIRLNCTYEKPVPIQFAVLFRYSQHREFLRWVLEHDGAVPIADRVWEGRPQPENHLVLLTDDPGFAYSLRLQRIRQLQLGEWSEINWEDLLRTLFEIKRYLSYSELAKFANEVLEIPVRGTESEQFPDAFRGPEGVLQLQQLSREFHVLLLRLMLLDGVTSGFFHGMVYFFTEDWLAEHNGRPPEAWHERPA